MLKVVIVIICKKCLFQDIKSGEQLDDVSNEDEDDSGAIEISYEDGKFEENPDSYEEYSDEQSDTEDRALSETVYERTNETVNKNSDLNATPETVTELERTDETVTKHSDLNATPETVEELERTDKASNETSDLTTTLDTETNATDVELRLATNEDNPEGVSGEAESETNVDSNSLTQINDQSEPKQTTASEPSNLELDENKPEPVTEDSVQEEVEDKVTDTEPEVMNVPETIVVKMESRTPTLSVSTKVLPLEGEISTESPDSNKDSDKSGDAPEHVLDEINEPENVKPDESKTVMEAASSNENNVEVKVEVKEETKEEVKEGIKEEITQDEEDEFVDSSEQLVAD